MNVLEAKRLPARKILVVNMNYLGDALMTTPALSALREAYPNAQIDVIAGEAKHYGAYEVLKGNPDINALIARDPGSAFARSRQLYLCLRRGGYDLAVILPSIAVYNFAASLAGVRKIVVPKLQGAEHMAAHLLNVVVDALSLPRHPRSLKMAVSAQAREEADRLLGSRSSRPLVAVNVGASRPQKRWPVAYFAELIAELSARADVVLLGGGNEADQEAAREIEELMSQSAQDAHKGFFDLVGRTSLGSLAAVIERADVLLTGDSGAMHIAAALGTPLAALFGSTQPAVTGPYAAPDSQVLYKALECSPCGSHPTCGGRFDCMRAITSGEAVRAVNMSLYSRRAQPLKVLR